MTSTCFVFAVFLNSLWASHALAEIESYQYEIEQDIEHCPAAFTKPMNDMNAALASYKHFKLVLKEGEKQVVTLATNQSKKDFVSNYIAFESSAHNETEIFENRLKYCAVFFVSPCLMSLFIEERIPGETYQKTITESVYAYIKKLSEDIQLALARSIVHKL